ncbi:MAG: sugar phosphate isomerase/epimerase [Planctomycetes bacterium]|nr:sugar phosphate isomerase/epimerase [Planctomycetota bacterium]
MPCDNIRDGLRPLGLVSNCWKVQLDSGNSLDSLVAEAVRLKLAAIELRQGSLGVYEAGSTCRPQADRLADLARRFPSVKFNVALSLPCLGSALTREDSMFLAGRSAAIALANRERPHLRLVDLQTRPEQCVTSSIETAARGLVELTEAMLEVEGILSIEHSWQPWPWFDSVMNAARRMLGERSARLRLCFDPCNLLLTEPSDDIASIVESIAPGDVSMIHVKQRRDGQVQSQVGDGDLDWPKLLKTLRQREHVAPMLFEIAPHVDVWANLENGIARLFGAAKV